MSAFDPSVRIVQLERELAEARLRASEQWDGRVREELRAMAAEADRDRLAAEVERLTPIEAEAHEGAELVAELRVEVQRLTASRDGYAKAEKARADEQHRLAEDNVRLATALKFYADVSKYPAPLTGGMGDLWSDCGEVARKALHASLQNGEKGE